MRRVDPQHRSIGRFVQDELIGPLEGGEFYIGTPADIPEDRIATIKDFGVLEGLKHVRELPLPLTMGMMNPFSLTARSFFYTMTYPPRKLCRPSMRVLEIPAANGIGQARAVARAYSAFAMGGGELGINEETMQELTAPAPVPSGGSSDKIIKVETKASLGFMKPFPYFPFSPSDKAFGTPGLGGAFGYADPDARIGYAYVPNKMVVGIANDSREVALRKAMYECLGRL
jgi:CubicO group peptidase (beta-lactamase class C family)